MIIIRIISCISHQWYTVYMFFDHNSLFLVHVLSNLVLWYHNFMMIARTMKIYYAEDTRNDTTFSTFTSHQTFQWHKIIVYWTLNTMMHCIFEYVWVIMVNNVLFGFTTSEIQNKNNFISVRKSITLLYPTEIIISYWQKTFHTCQLMSCRTMDARFWKSVRTNFWAVPCCVVSSFFNVSYVILDSEQEDLLLRESGSVFEKQCAKICQFIQNPFFKKRTMIVQKDGDRAARWLVSFDD